ncbi:MAG: ABC transporter ATP-binding protein [Lautropia sp.]
MSDTLSSLILDFARRHARAYLLAGAMLAGVSLLTAWVPRIVGGSVDALVAGELSTADLARRVALLLAMGVAIYLLRVGWRTRLYGAAQRLGVELRTRFYRALAGHGPDFFQARRTGDLMALATNDIDAIEMAAGEAFLAGFDGTLTLVIVIAMMSVGVDARLAVLALLPFPLMAIGFWWISRRVHDASHASLDAFSRLNEQTQESLAGVRTVRALGLQSQVHAEFSRRAARAAATGFDALRWESAYEPVVGLTMTAAMAIALGVGGTMVAARELTVGELTAFTMYLGQLIWPMFAMGWVLSLVERGRAAFGRLHPVLAETPGIRDDGTIDTVVPGALEIDDLSFAYPRRAAPVLERVSVSIEPGRTLAIVGPTGAGKSTLVSLLLRQHEASCGEIRLGGQPLGAYRLDALRRAIAWVPQEAFLFSASIADNIALARPGASRAQIEAAARLADLDRDVAGFADGYDTLVGERGVTLSGGQRQRVAIARALIADAPLLVLDDVLSAVDTATEARILSHLRTSVRRTGAGARDDRRSIVIVGHRLSGIADADLIVVLSKGRIVERGSHAQLLARDGWYAAQWRYQQLEASLDGD